MNSVLLLLAIIITQLNGRTIASALSPSKISNPALDSEASLQSIWDRPVRESKRQPVLRPLMLSRRSPRTKHLGKRLSLLNTNATITFTTQLIQTQQPTNSTNLNSTTSKATNAAGFSAIFGNSMTSVAVPSSSSMSQATYENLIRYAKFSSAAYASQCSTPGGATLVQQILGSAASTPALGYIARDDTSKEFIVAFKGDPSLQIFSMTTANGQIASLKDVSSASFHFGGPAGAAVNVDILNVYLGVSPGLLQTIQSLLASRTGYGVTFTGHGTGGALASLAGVAHAVALGSSTPMQVITYGAPRVGNAIWAKYTDSLFLTAQTARYLRVTHSDDNVPQMLLPANGYAHSSLELFQPADTTSAMEMVQCTGSEDPKCNDASAQSATASGSSQTSASVAASPVAGPGQPVQNAQGLSGATSSDTSVPNMSTSNYAWPSSSPQSAATAPAIGLGTSTASATSQNNVLCSMCSSTDCVNCIDDRAQTQNNPGASSYGSALSQGLTGSSVSDGDDGGSFSVNGQSSNNNNASPYAGSNTDDTAGQSLDSNNASQYAGSNTDDATGQSLVNNSVSPYTGANIGYAADQGMENSNATPYAGLNTDNAADLQVPYSADNAGTMPVSPYTIPIAAFPMVYALRTNTSVVHTMPGSHLSATAMNATTVDHVRSRRQVLSAVNAAHLSYLGLAITQDGAEFCSTLSTVSNLVNNGAGAADLPKTPSSLATSTRFTGASVDLVISKVSIALMMGICLVLW